MRKFKLKKITEKEDSYLFHRMGMNRGEKVINARIYNSLVHRFNKAKTHDERLNIHYIFRNFIKKVKR